MAGWHHWLDGCESEWTPGVGDGQGGLACCDSWGRKESDTTERLNWTELNWSLINWPIFLIALPNGYKMDPRAPRNKISNKAGRKKKRSYLSPLSGKKTSQPSIQVPLNFHWSELDYIISLSWRGPRKMPFAKEKGVCDWIQLIDYLLTGTIYIAKVVVIKEGNRSGY